MKWNELNVEKKTKGNEWKLLENFFAATHTHTNTHMYVYIEVGMKLHQHI